MRVFGVLVLALLCAGCAVKREYSRSSEPNLLLTAGNTGEDVVQLSYAVQPWVPGTLPVTLDRLMLNIHRQAQGKKYSFIISDEPTVINEYNAYAAKLIAGSDGKCDLRAAREKFFREKFGDKAAVPMLEYCRILERRTLTAFTGAGLFAPKKPMSKDIFTPQLLDVLESQLSMAVELAKNTPYAGVVQDEYEFFCQSRQIIEQRLRGDIRSFEVDREVVEFQELVGILGDPPQRKTSAQCSVSPDKKEFIIRLKADEPAMDKRLISGAGRDYAKAWNDDCFEIFIVPDMKKSNIAMQFVITSAGALWDAKWHGLAYDAKWNSNAVLQVTHHKTSWDAELRIPFEDMGLKWDEPQDFRMNIYRFRKVRGAAQEKSAWTPIPRGSNLQPDNFGWIIRGK